MAFSFRLPDNLRSTDFKVFEALYKIMFGAIKKNINEITDLKDINRCPDYMLPELASSVGCPYLTNTSPYANRQLIKYWWVTIRSKGTESAIRTMAALGLLCYDSINTYVNDIVVYNRTIDVVYDKNTGSIYLQVAYQGSDNNKEAQEEWMKELIEYVRPAGFNTIFQPAEFTNPYLNVKVQLATGIDSRQYSTDIFSAIIPNVTDVGDEAPLCFGTYDIDKINYIDNSNLTKLTITDPVITNLQDFETISNPTYSSSTITFTLPTDTNAATFIDNSKIYPQTPVYIDVIYVNDGATSTAHLIANKYTSGTSIITDLSTNSDINSSSVNYSTGAVSIPFTATSITTVKVKYAKASVANVLVEPLNGSTFSIDTARLKLHTTDISGYYTYGDDSFYAPITFNAVVKKYSSGSWSDILTESNLSYKQVLDLLLSSTNTVSKLAVYINIVPSITKDGHVYCLNINYFDNILIKYLNTLTVMKASIGEDSYSLKCDGATYSNSSFTFDCPYRDKCMKYSNSFLTESVTSFTDNHKIAVPNIDTTKTYKYCRVWHNTTGSTVVNTLYYLDIEKQTASYVYTSETVSSGISAGDKIILYTEDITDYGIGMSEISTISKFTLGTDGIRTLNANVTDNRFDAYPKLVKCSMSNISRMIDPSGSDTSSSNLIDVGTTITAPTDNTVYWYVFTLTAASGSTLPNTLSANTIMIQDLTYNSTNKTFNDIDISSIVVYNKNSGIVKFGVANHDDTANHIVKLTGNIYINLTLT